MTATSVASVESADHPSVELRNFLAPVEILIYRSSIEPEWLVVKVHVRASDRDTGDLDDFGYETRLLLPVSNEQIALTVREMISSQLAHEIDECLFIDGIRKFDPHATGDSQ